MPDEASVTAGVHTQAASASEALSQNARLMNSVVAALRAVGMGLLDDHVRHCVRESIEAGDGETKVEELMAAVARFAK